MTGKKEGDSSLSGKRRGKAVSLPRDFARRGGGGGEGERGCLTSLCWKEKRESAFMLSGADLLQREGGKREGKRTMLLTKKK